MLRGSRAEELRAARGRRWGELGHRIRALEGGNAKKEVEALGNAGDLLKQLADLKGAGDGNEREKPGARIGEAEDGTRGGGQLGTSRGEGGWPAVEEEAPTRREQDGRPPPINLATGGTPRGAMRQLAPVAPSEQHLQPKIIGLEMQVRELTSTQGQLERERSVLKRRCVDAEEQLAAIQGYLGTHIGRYQKEILRLRERLNYLEKA